MADADALAALLIAVGADGFNVRTLSLEFSLGHGIDSSPRLMPMPRGFRREIRCTRFRRASWIRHEHEGTRSRCRQRNQALSPT